MGCLFGSALSLPIAALLIGLAPVVVAAQTLTIGVRGGP